MHVLAQFMQQPRDDRWDAALCVVRYLKGNPKFSWILSVISDSRHIVSRIGLVVWLRGAP